jgi:hypothetical protein
MAVGFGTATRRRWIATMTMSAALSAACSITASAETIDQI